MEAFLLFQCLLFLTPITFAGADNATLDAFWSRLNATSRQRKAIAREAFLWPGGEVPYQLAPGMSWLDWAIIKKIMQDIESQTRNCVRFVKQTNQTGYIFFPEPRRTYWHPVNGTTGSMQIWPISSLWDRKVTIKIIVTHLLSFLGIQWEITRTDRDSFVTINWDNVYPLTKQYLQTQERSILTALPFDYQSATNALPYDVDILPLFNYSVPFITSKLADRKFENNGSLSVLDVARILLTYKCFNPSAVYDALRHAGMELGKNPNGTLPGDWEGYIQSMSPLTPAVRLDVGAIRENATGKGGFLNWSKGRVPYVIDRSLTAKERNQLLAGMEKVSSVTNGCIVFQARSEELDYVTFSTLPVDSQKWVIGRRGGQQTSLLEPGCLFQRACRLKSFLKLLGFGREVTRIDADTYIWINWDNLIEEEASRLKFLKNRASATFLLEENWRFGLPYDYESLLHPTWNGHSKDIDEPSYIPKTKGQFLGPPTGDISLLDQARLLLGYQCIEPDELKRQLAANGIDVESTFPEGQVTYRNRLARENKSRIINKFLDDVGDIAENGHANGRFIWPNGRVPFSMDPRLDPLDVKFVTGIMEMISNVTRGCIQFVPRRDESAFVYFVWANSTDDCGNLLYSPWMYYLSPFCLTIYGTYRTWWNLFKLLGFTAEFVRPDRDEYVNIRMESIKPNSLFNAVIDPRSSTFSLPYDYASITNIQWWGMSTQNFSEINKKPNMPYVGSDNTEMLSYLDVARLLMGYQCAAPEKVRSALRLNNLIPVEDDQVQNYGAPSNIILGPVIGSIVGLFGLLAVTLGVCLYLRCRRRVRVSSAWTESGNSLTPYLRSGLDISMEIEREKVHYGKTVIGSGEFGTVYKGSMFEAEESSHNLMLVAVKEIHCANLQAFQQFVKEVEVMAKLEQHTNIVALLGVVSKGEQLIVMEYCPHGSIGMYLSDLNRKQKFRSCIHDCGDLEGTWTENKRDSDRDTLSTYDLMNFSYQIARGMEFLSAYHIIHRDLAARNVLMCENRVVKIGDFGLARRKQINYIMVDKQIDDTKLPAKWMAPEALKELLFNEKTDVWSFGVVLWEIFSLGQIPFNDPGQCSMKSNTVAWWIQMLEGGHRLPKPSGTPLEIYAMMQSSWLLNPAERPGFRELRSTLQKLVIGSTYLKLDKPDLDCEGAEAPNTN
ncbi:putative Fibroblast growth factor receptor 1 [Hypsibius exemplaris]|uniref:Fibroblast growth factor receptor 1 n=1 Tax=Hypsibius exemplaris TaxID=2072580 RepID=A0A1W0X9F8_HYPEX|nr:putative Fibroblast growth factor receptor 1 [Hypsibius exemplaris]